VRISRRRTILVVVVAVIVVAAGLVAYFEFVRRASPSPAPAPVAVDSLSGTTGTSGAQATLVLLSHSSTPIQNVTGRIPLAVGTTTVLIWFYYHTVSYPDPLDDGAAVSSSSPLGGATAPCGQTVPVTIAGIYFATGNPSGDGTFSEVESATYVCAPPP
jgi:hypothetical protein